MRSARLPITAAALAALLALAACTPPGATTEEEGKPTGPIKIAKDAGVG